MTDTYTEQLAQALSKAGVTPGQAGAILLPEGSPQARNRTGKRVLEASTDISLERAAELCAGLGKRLVIDGARLRIY